MRGTNLYTAVACLALLAAVRPAAADPPGAVHRPPEGRVARATFTHGIRDREPIDRVVTLDNRARSLYYFTELRNLQGHTVVHRWRYHGQVLAEVPFHVGGPRWRVYSRKTLLPHQLGRWAVEVVDQDSGWPLRVDYFEYVAAPAGEAGAGDGAAGPGGSTTASSTTASPASPARDAAPGAGAAAGVPVPRSGSAAGAAGAASADGTGDAAAGRGAAGAATEDASAPGR
ncbi:MAG: DUF2914 domain-containing protein [Gammaproteobacteria bacterium]|nr:MAG: DUF2914 domain-containing protein [Gammaproteobacteria bacterium]